MSSFSWPPEGAGGGGSVNSVTASSPLASSGGANPNISLSGIVSVANGGTGLSSPGTSGNVLTSDGVNWISSAPVSGGANTALSNLIATSINQNLVPDTNLTKNLGSATIRWSDGYINNLKDNAAVVCVGVQNRTLNATTGAIVASFATTGIFGLQAGVGLDLAGSTSGVITLRAANTTTSYSIKFPSAQGTAATVLTNDGSGNLSWSASGGGGTQNLEYHTVTAPEATAKQFSLSATPVSSALVLVDIITGVSQQYSVDFTITGSTFDWNGLGLDGILTTGDIVRLQYTS